MEQIVPGGTVPVEVTKTDSQFIVNLTVNTDLFDRTAAYVNDARTMNNSLFNGTPTSETQLLTLSGIWGVARPIEVELLVRSGSSSSYTYSSIGTSASNPCAKIRLYSLNTDDSGNKYASIGIVFPRQEAYRLLSGGYLTINFADIYDRNYTYPSGVAIPSIGNIPVTFV
ncbi:MAG: hypothetical protein HUJ56_12165 [Erysipelotrichaceae bacterium]|nr:hypothetical protein [Erysipelotrichaceae bacterium]